MRSIWITSLCLASFACTGCGSDSAAPSSGESTKPVGVPLSISHPKTEANTLQARTAEHRAAVDALVDKATQAVSARRADLAIEALSQAIGIDPADSRLLRMRADVYAMSGELASARADFSTAILADPTNAELRNVRGYFLMTNGATPEAMDDFNKAIQLDPECAAAWNNRGLVHLQNGDYPLAEKQFKVACECQSDYADAWNNLGFAKMKQDRLDEALLDTQRSLKANPEYITAWNNCGLIHIRQEDYQSAVQAFSKAIDLAPLDPRWYSHRQIALIELERFSDAAQDQGKVEWINELNQSNVRLARDTTDIRQWIERGNVFLAGEMFDEAIRDFTSALQLNPVSVDALNGRARAYTATDKIQKALDDCDESIVINATPKALSLRGDTWLAMGNLDNALSDFEGAMRCDMTVAETYRERAAARQAAGEDDLAQADLAAAQRIEDALEGRLVDNSGKAAPLPEDIDVDLSDVAPETDEPREDSTGDGQE